MKADNKMVEAYERGRRNSGSESPVKAGLDAVLDYLDSVPEPERNPKAQAPNWIRQILNELEITQVELARITGFSQKYISEMAGGKVNISKNVERKLMAIQKKARSKAG